MPGQSVDKLVTVVNEGTGESWIRVGVSSRIDAADGTELPLELTNGEDVLSFDINVEKWTDGEDVLSFDNNEEKWTDGEDGYYYYADPVDPGDVTEQLFSQVTFNKLMGNEYQNCTAYVDVAAQAVQVKHNGETVFDAAGWPAN